MKRPSKRQREFDRAFEKAASALDWRGNPDEVCADVANRLGVPPGHVRAAVFACQNYDEALAQRLY